MNLLRSGQKLEVCELCSLVGLSDEKSNRDSIRKILLRLREKGLCDRRPSRTSPRSNVWYWKKVSEHDTSFVSTSVMLPQSQSPQPIQPFEHDNFHKEGGECP
jgi:hypothetical protein